MPVSDQITIHEPIEIQRSNDDELDCEVSLNEGNTFNAVFKQGSLIVSEFKSMTFKEVSKLPHDIILKTCFSTMGDMPLLTIERLNDQSDRLTPDIIYQESADTFSVIELKTTRSSSHLTDRYNEALTIYYDALAKRSKKIKLFSLAVSATSIITNLPLSKDLSDNIMLLYRSALLAMNKLRDIGWSSVDLEVKEQIRSVQSSISKLTIPETSDDPLIITMESVKRWRTMDTSIVSSLFVKNCRESMKEAYTENNASDMAAADSQIHDFNSALSAGRRDAKSPVQLPLYIPSEETCDPFELYFDCVTDEPIVRLWRSVLSSYHSNPDRWEKISEEDQYEISMGNSVINNVMRKTDKRKHFRVDADLSGEDWIQLAKYGIEAKSKRSHGELIEKREKDQTPFSIDCSVRDIDDFVFSSNHLIPKSHKNLLSYNIESLIKLANLGEETESKRFVDMFFQTDIGKSLSVLQYILTEVNISRLQNCQDHQFVFKFLPEINALILIKPTKASEHIFFSVATKNGNTFGRPFKEFFKVGDDWSISEFVSMDINRLSHQIASPERACSLLAFWCQQFEILPCNFFASMNEEIVCHFNSSLLFYLEDKESTSSDMQVTRYAYMEMIKGPGRSLNPFKVLKKFSCRPRSRLLCWFYRRFIASFREMLLKPPVFGLRDTSELSEESSQDTAQNLLSWVSGKPIRRFEIALNLSYFGVLHNKEEGNKLAGFLKIFEKVIGEERVLKDCDKRYMGLEEPPLDHEYKSHEFSPAMVSEMGRTMRSYLESKGNGSMNWIKDKILENLASKDILEFATMKASAVNVSPNDLYHKDLEMNQRQRTTEGVFKLLKEGISPRIMTDIHRIEEKVSQDGGLIANLFKKLQIGGTREIFVLTIESRILVHLCETTTRMVCEEMPNEMLTKGDQKMLKNDVHFRTLNKLSGRFSTTVSSSDDATTWAQRFVMNMFGCFIVNLFDDEIAIPLCNVLNHCTNKRLELPRELLQLFLDHPEIDSFSDNINELKSQFSGRSTVNDLVDKGTIGLKNRSNMMQGIFHYTSSLIHSAFLLQWQKFSDMFITNMLDKEVEYVITTKVSSDDSSVLISTRFNNERERRKINKVFLTLTYLKRRLYKYMCSKQSKEKSTEGVFWTIEEFNSTWLMRNTLVMPLIKFVVSSCQVHTNPKLESRLYTSSTMRSQVLENCGTIMLTAIIQLCQARLHYITIGALNHILWERFSDVLMSNPHPSAGFMPFEPEISCGLLGSDYATYLFYKENESARKIQQYLYRSMGVEYSAEGNPTSRVLLTFGQNAKYYRFLENMGLARKGETMEDLNKTIDDNVQVLYRKAESPEESLLKLLIKASSPELSQAFDFLTSSKSFAASVYLLRDPCMHLLERNSEGTLTVKKISLMKWATELRKDESGNDEILKINYPSWQFYDNFRKHERNLSLKSISLTNRRRRVFISVPIPKQSSLTPISLMDCMKRIWFGMDTRGSEAAVESTYAYFKRFYNWLERDYNTCLANSPYDSHIVMYNFLVSLTPKNKSVRLTTPSRIKQSGFLTLVDAMCRNQFPIHVLLRNNEIKTKDDVNYTLDNMLASSWLAKSCPPYVIKDYAINKICKSYPDTVTEHPDIVSLMTQGVMRFNMMMVQSAILRPESTMSLLQKYNRGVFGGFINRQKYDAEKGVYYGKGTFVGSVDGTKFSMDIENCFVRRVTVEDTLGFINRISVFRNFTSDLGLSYESDSKMGMNFLGFKETKLGAWGSGKLQIIKDFVIDYFVNKSLTVNCDRIGRIRLKTNEERPITVLSFVPNVRTVPHENEYNIDFGQPVMNSWMKMQSCPFEKAVDLISEKTLADDELGRWVYTSLLRRMRNEGFDIRAPNVKIEVTERVEPATTTPFDEFNVSWGDDMMDFAMELQDFSDFSEEETDEFRMADNFKEAFDMLAEIDDYTTRQPIKLIGEVDAFSHHPFWDEYIRRLNRMSNHMAIEDAVSNEDVSYNTYLVRLQDFVNLCRETYGMRDVLRQREEGYDMS